MPNDATSNRDIVLHYKDGGLQHISELHRSYNSLQYPLPFPYGTDGCYVNLKLQNGRKLTAMVYYRYHNIMVRQTMSVLLHAKWLFRSTWLMPTAKLRLRFLKHEQASLRADCYQDLQGAILDRDGDPSIVGCRIVLPSTLNPNWPEIKDNLLPGQDPQDCSDIVARVFRLKAQKLVEMLKSNM